jgi:hypothetical protein
MPPASAADFTVFQSTFEAAATVGMGCAADWSPVDGTDAGLQAARSIATSSKKEDILYGNRFVCIFSSFFVIVVSFR